MIIGISGKVGSGKDTVGKIIQHLVYCKHINKDLIFEDRFPLPYISNQWEIKKFAGKLKQIVSIFTGIPVKDLEKQEVKNRVLGEEWWYYKLPNGSLISYTDKNQPDFIKKHPLVKPTIRQFLQLLGTDAMRNIIHPNCWLNALFVDYIQGDIEIWKDIKNYEGKYQISNFGRIRGLDRKIVYGNVNKGEYHTKKQNILKSSISGKYKVIKLEGNNSLLVHRLVAEHFIENIENKPYVNHIDQNPLNNFYKNLEWCTQSENIISANKAGNGNIGEKQADAKLNEEKVLKIKELLKTNIRQKEIAKMFNVGQTTITDIKKGRKWKHIEVKKQPISPILPKSGSNWIITDVRFPNEAKAVKDRGGILIRINRDRFRCSNCSELVLGRYNCQKCGTDQLIQEYHSKHISETALDDFTDWNYVIENNSDIPHLIKEVKKMLKHFKLI